LTIYQNLASVISDLTEIKLLKTENMVFLFDNVEKSGILAKIDKI